MLSHATPAVTIQSSSNFVKEHTADLTVYYQSIISDSSAAEQERSNRDDLLEIANGRWDDLGPAQRGLIALLCNNLL